MLPLLTALFAAPAAATLSQEQNLDRRQSTVLDNPPLDEPLLAVQIGGIVGAYVIFVAITITLLLVVGRRLRRTVQASNFTLQVEMMKPKAAPITTTMPANSTDPSPVTPTNKAQGFRSWTSLTKGHTRGSNNASVSTVDHASVVAADRRRAQDQMEMLYAAVMAHDEQRAAAATSPVSPIENVDLKELPPRSPTSYQNHHANPFSDYAQRVPEAQPVQHYQHQLAAAAAALPPTSPRSTTSRRSRLSNLSLFHSNRDPNVGAAQPSPNKIRSPRFPLRKLPISSPLASPHAVSPTSDQVPLSPRLYNPPPPPVPPITRTSTSTTMSDRPRQAIPAPLNLTPGGNSSSSLPFREAYPQLLSAPPTKTTILERPDKHLNGPRTGLPTPYSPYMPFTPLTPLTPSRIVTKKQRKREGRENGLRALNEEDAVRDENDMWGY
ncbi:hypothetical protein BJY04DRAFT_77413 [Aspergillus karnatakaensis]|uniref:uncharacterized protein n=1 Tax=Aspergillus karnatakaensis TaxID=1810916 RepID=UPI003CCCB2A1